ncbi:MAG: membrane-bound O-acyltransferase family protein [Deltaproteobacteria bacterium]|nr:MAG: membrane-bound O-acyltransferase family protein [Deltaproteobacteria bacterium]
MVFSSVSFLFFFLPAVLLLYLFSGKYRNSILLIASLFFYFWGEGIYLLVMLLSIGTNFVCGNLMFSEGRLRKNARYILAVALVINFSMLGLFKYASFITDNINILLGGIGLPPIEMGPTHLPIGISFFTFQAVSYLIDIYRGEVRPQKNLVRLALYISLFPQLIAGPIVRYRDIASALSSRLFSAEDIADGIRRFIYGLSKKVLLANPLALTADTIFAIPASGLSTPVAWLGAVCFSLQIYFDFSGYSDMAIGLGRIFGFRFLENFNYPYIAKSIQDFWRRWHISLSSWFRDYLYIPLGGNRAGVLRTGIHLFIVFFLCGLWHGAAWTFVCWGLYHGFFLVLERTFIGTLLAKIWQPVRHGIVLLIIVVGWVIFKSETLADCGHYLAAMFYVHSVADQQLINFYLDKKLIWELSFAGMLSMPVVPALKRLYFSYTSSLSGQSFVFFHQGLFEGLRLCTLVVLSYFAVISLAADVYNPFIYFRF